MRFILDTNVIIPLEDSSKVLERPLAEFVKASLSSNNELLYHPATIDDINRDNNLERREISLSRLKKYSQFDESAWSAEELTALFGDIKKINDWCDCRILLSLHKNGADFLISEDVELHRKARAVGLSDRVLYIQQAYSRFPAFEGYASRLFPGISEQSLAGIPLEHPIFDSLKSSYMEFSEWYVRCQREGRKAWTVSTGDDINALLIYKIENSPIVTNDSRGLKNKVLKLCTFKVSELSQGRKYGELLLKKSFVFAYDNSISWVYLTVRQGTQPHLIDLLESFGFCAYGESTQKNGKIDTVFVKAMEPDKSDAASSIDFATRYYPWFRVSKSTSSYLVPIAPKYHRQLFPEIQNPFDLFGHSVIAGNAIKQAYICNAKIRKISAGDLVLFYRSSDQKSITTVGVVENAEFTSDAGRVQQLSRKRTIYESQAISAMCKKGALVIIFRMMGHFKDPIDSDSLKKMGVIGPIQSIRTIEHDLATGILTEGKVGNCLFAD